VQKVSSPETSQLEERMRELERRLDAKENMCKHLEENLNEVKSCLEEQKQRGISELKQRDLHIEELNRRNQELTAAANMRFTVVPVSDSDGELKDTLPYESRIGSATSGEIFRRRGSSSFADDVGRDKDMRTLADLRLSKEKQAEGQKEHDPDPRPRTRRPNGQSQSQRTPPRRVSGGRKLRDSEFDPN